MNGDIEDNFIGKLLGEMKSNFNKSPTNKAEDSSGNIAKETIVNKPSNKVDSSDEKKVVKLCINEKNSAKKIADTKADEKMRVQKRLKNCDNENAKRLKTSAECINSTERIEPCLTVNDDRTSADEKDQILSTALDNTSPELIDDKCVKVSIEKITVYNKLHADSEKLSLPEVDKEVKEVASPGRRSLRLKTIAPEGTKKKDNDICLPNLKRSPRRRSKDYCESVLANAIARKEKSYEPTTPQPQQRLSRRIKPTAKVLANRELRLGIEMQNDVRSSLSNDISKQKNSEVPYDTPKIHKAKSEPCENTSVDNSLENNADLAETLSKKSLKQMQEKHLGILGLKAVDADCPKSESTSSRNSINNSPNDKKHLSSFAEPRNTSRRSLRERVKKQIDTNIENNSAVSLKDNYKKLFKRSIIPHSSSFSEDQCGITSENISKNDTTKDVKEEMQENKYKKDNKTESEINNSILTDSFTKENNNHTQDNINCACHCYHLSNVYVNLENRIGNIYCGAVDSIDNRFIGCTNCILDNGVPVESKKDIMLLRASPRLPYVLLCTSHASRLTKHLSCAGCGAFCTQGSFVQCSNRHLYHRQCSIIKNKSVCPHCGIESPTMNIQVLMRRNFNTVFMPNQDDSLMSARMSFSSNGIDISNKASEELDNRPDTPPILNTNIIAMLANMKDFKSECSQYTAKDLLKAIKSNDYEKLILVLASEVDINSIVKDSTKSTALHEAAELGHMGVIHILVVCGAELDILDKTHKTPLMTAILADQLEAVLYLIKAGCDSSFKGPDGMTALHLAAKDGNLEACRLLVTSSRTSMAHVDAVDEGGWTPLVWAAEHGHAIVIRYLLEQNADPFVTDSQQNIVLHWAALNGSAKITEMLLDRGCHVNVMNVNGDTPLHIAARYSNYQCALILITRGAKVNCVNCANESPLDSCEVVDGECYNLIKVNAALQKILPNKERSIILTNDISRGKEQNPIQCVNQVDNETEPKDYTYVTNVYVSSSDVHVDTRLSALMGCECDERCLGPNCNCVSLTSKCPYDEEGKLSDDFDFDDPPMIFECNERCNCNKITCLNRVVQRGISSRLELFRTSNCGWSVRTLREIRRGSFVSEYTGEILTDFDAKRRDVDSYLFDIYTSSDESYCLDGRFYGNISRFINHMCTPNLTPIRVFTDHQDIKFPRIGFFANRDIEADEELGFDYGDKFWAAKQNEFTCQCGSDVCRYSIDTISETLDQYNKN